MLDFGFGELLLLGSVALIVLGPEKLPHVARMAGAWYGRIRRQLMQIQREIEQEVHVAEMRKAMNEELAKLRDIQSEVQAQAAQHFDTSEPRIMPDPVPSDDIPVLNPELIKVHKPYFYIPPSAASYVMPKAPWRGYRPQATLTEALHD